MFVEEARLFPGGGDSVVVCGDSLVCVRYICECVVEAANEPPEFGGVSVVCDSIEKLFPFNLLFVLDMIRYFFVKWSESHKLCLLGMLMKLHACGSRNKQCNLVFMKLHSKVRI